MVSVDDIDSNKNNEQSISVKPIDWLDELNKSISPPLPNPDIYDVSTEPLAQTQCQRLNQGRAHSGVETRVWPSADNQRQITNTTRDRKEGV